MCAAGRGIVTDSEMQGITYNSPCRSALHTYCYNAWQEGSREEQKDKVKPTTNSNKLDS